MAGEKNFILKNGLSVGTNDVLDSSGDLVAAAFGTAALEVIDDQVNTLLTAGTDLKNTPRFFKASSTRIIRIHIPLLTQTKRK